MAALTILSMGWGVQTWTLAAMAALGQTPRPNFIVFADTGHEHAGTHEFIRRWSPWLGEHGLDVVTVQGDRTDVVRDDWSDSVMIPAFTVEAATGKIGQVRRQCTHDWKIVPIRRFIREEMARRRMKLLPGSVEVWQGISTDEWVRMKDSNVAYIEHRYPLVDLRFSRSDCVFWLERHGLEVPPKSSCTFCPFKSIGAFRELKRRGGPDWQEAEAVDRSIRGRRPQHGPLYVHPKRMPLAEAIQIPEDQGATQLGLFGADGPCDSGYCMT